MAARVFIFSAPATASYVRPQEKVPGSVPQSAVALQIFAKLPAPT